jgi:branched-chain amino acid transport system ATP-binding protein
MLKIENLHVYYGGIHAVKGLNLQVQIGEIVTLIGCNGAGKSTILRTISGLLKPKEGSIHLEGKGPIHGLEPHEIVKSGISQVPEGRAIFANLSVLENLQIGAYLRKDKGAIQEDMEKAFLLFPRLKERKGQNAATLSGGEQQMLAISRALMARPKLLLLDEPSLGLAPLVVQSIFKTIQEINKEGTTILLVEQNANMALTVANRGYVIQTGELVLEGKGKDLLETERVRQFYLGEA